jgi:hypothetical protein
MKQSQRGASAEDEYRFRTELDSRCQCGIVIGNIVGFPRNRQARREIGINKLWLGQLET